MFKIKITWIYSSTLDISGGCMHEDIVHHRKFPTTNLKSHNLPFIRDHFYLSIRDYS